MPSRLPRLPTRRRHISWDIFTSALVTVIVTIAVGTVGVAFDTITAHAGAPRQLTPPAPSPFVVRDRFDALKRALESIAPGLNGDTTTYTRSGREDLVVFSNAETAAVLLALKQAYSSQIPLAGGFTVAGWAHLNASDSHTFTLKDVAERRAVIEVFEEQVQTRIVMWGVGSMRAPTRRPLSELPMRMPPLPATR